MASEIIDALAAAPQPMRLTALANQLGETKAKIHRHLTMLKYLGLVDHDRTNSSARSLSSGRPRRSATPW
jgi:DNA-binding IclR family transcriptional regulator